MSSFLEFRENFNNTLLSLPDANYASGRHQIIMKCRAMNCDANKPRESRHFYVKADFKEGDVPVFYCQKCKSKGVVTSKLIREWGLYDNDTAVALNKYLRTGVDKSNYRKLQKGDKQRLVNPKPVVSEQSITKLRYLNRRLGVSFKAPEIMQLKIVLNLYDLLNFNRIDKLTVSNGIGDILHEDFMGFISYNNEYINMRNIGSRLDKRYFNYNIFNLYDNTKRFYVIPNQVDIMNPEPVEIIMTEGVFDLISLWEHVYNRDMTNRIFVAICGSGFDNVIRYFIKFGFIRHNITIYSDKDVGLGYYRYIKKSMYPILDSNLTIHYNNYHGEKDFGTTPDKFDISTIIV